MAHVKGQNVNLLVYDSSTSKYAVIAASTSADFSVQANSTDGSAKDDANPLWDNPEFTYYDWSCSNESFVCDIASLKTLIKTVATGTATVQVQFQVGNSSTDKLICKKGTAIISSLEVTADVSDYAKLSISLEGASELSDGTWTTITTATATRTKIRGKALMVAIDVDDEGTHNTICASTSHKLSLSVQTSDTKTKDDNDKAISKDVTGKSLTLSTENLVDLHENGQPSCIDAGTLLGNTMEGNKLAIYFGYYPSSIGKSVPDEQGSEYSWGEATDVVIEGYFICTSFSLSGENKNDATMSAEFSLCGAPSIS